MERKTQKEEKESLAVKTFARRHKIDAERSSVEKLKTGYLVLNK